MTSKPPTEKEQLRRVALHRRSETHGRLFAQAAEAVRLHGLELIARTQGSVISGYLPIRDELSPVPLLEALNAQDRILVLPVIETKWAPLIFRLWRPGDPLRNAGFGLREPLADRPLIPPDILLIPLAAFDSTGFRIGYGGGYYDRTLALYRAERMVAAIGIAYDEQEVPSFIHSPHDQRLDYVITPAGVRIFGT